eukprot:TRINITY_DN2067_c0_g1_i3.p1 TRINITY_DN2067_c0_g1~~TRINITY_DN2067_c0_g1_i3.p1  ORF type:complete len:955 (-),score=339.67 TRINITY_DN2067_c0_g1_i3:292-3156(-)
MAPSDVQPVPYAGRNPFKLSLDDLAGLRDQNALTSYGGPRGIAEALHSSVQDGISTDNSETMEARRGVFGINVVPRTPPKSLIRLFFEAFNDFTLIILICAAIVSILLGVLLSDHPEEEWIEGAAILVAVLLVTTVTAINDWSKEKQFRKLDDKNKAYNTVIRDGQMTEIVVDDILVGDIVVIKTGDFVPADGLFLEGNNLLCDESAMTGESDQVPKSAGSVYFLAGTKCTEGSGRMVVIGVGVNTEMGRTMAAIDESAGDNQTPLELKLELMAKRIGQGGLAVGVLVFILLLIYWIVDNVEDGDFSGDDWREVLDFFIVGVVILVVAIPEGLPLAVTISLAYSTIKMFEDQNLVRTLAACETMGGATNICSDKTGTLTQNKMTAVQAWIAGQFVEDITAVQASSEVANLVCSGIAINSSVYSQPDPKNPGKKELVGNKTEIALLNAITHFGLDWEKLRSDQEHPSNVIYPFNSAIKTMSTVVTVDNHRRLYTKGAPDFVIKTCTMVLDEEGKHQPLDDAKREELQQALVKMAGTGLRTLALAYADFEQDTSEKFDGPTAPSKDLTMIGIVGIKDPLRPEVPDAVASCKTAGIFVRMVTGDNILTAQTIARECGILTDGVAIEGKAFREMSEEDRIAILPKLQVMARSNPTDKLLLVETLLSQGEVVSVTGDGTNDAAALSRADVGLAMGIAGTQVAKDASDIVILDDNFSSIVRAVMWGRTVYDNIRKFLQFQLTINLVALVLVTLGAASRRESFPLTPVQMLWVNLIMDTFAALALGTEEPTSDLLLRQPYGRNDRLVNKQMVRNICGQGFVQILVCALIMFTGHKWFNFYIAEASLKHYTMLFNTFVWFQVFNEINSRKLHDDSPGNIFTGLSKNYIFICIVVGTGIFQAVIVEFVGSFADTEGQSWEQWLVAVCLGFLSIPVGTLLRMIPVKNNTVSSSDDVPDLRTGTV